MSGVLVFEIVTLLLTIGSVAPQAIRSFRYRTVEGVSATTTSIGPSRPVCSTKDDSVSAKEGRRKVQIQTVRLGLTAAMGIRSFDDRIMNGSLIVKRLPHKREQMR